MRILIPIFVAYPLPDYLFSVRCDGGSRAVPHAARALAASAVSAVDTHPSNWNSGCTDLIQQHDKAELDCNLVVIHSLDVVVHSLVVVQHHTNSHCHVDEGTRLDLDLLSYQLSFPLVPYHRLMLMMTYWLCAVDPVVLTS